MNDDLRQRRRYFGAALLLQALVFGYLILTRRLPRGHDTQSVFLLQYLYLCQASPGGAVLWLPCLAQGVASTWFTTLQAGLLQNVLLLIGGVPDGTPMLPLFYAGLFLEDLLLLIGVWKLGGRFYRSPAAQFFVALAAVGSSMWISNLYWNHRLIYGIPLTLALLLDVLDTGSRPKLFLAASLAALQLMGNAIYIPVLSMLTLGLFLGVHILFAWKRLRLSVPLLRPRPIDAAWLAAIGAVFASVLIAITQGLGSMRQYHVGRNPDGSVTLDAFLTYAGGANPLRYLDLLLGLTPSNDYSLYSGILTVLLALLALFHRPTKPVLTFVLCLLVLLFFSMGYLSWIGMAGYTAFYPLHYFRYIGLAAPLVKLFLILLAGFGVDAFARPRGDDRKSFQRASLATAGLSLVWLAVLALPSDPLASFLRTLQDGLALRPEARSAGLSVAILAAAAGLCFWRSRQERLRILLPLLLLLQGADLFRWRLQLLREESVPLDETLAAVQKVRPLPYLARRSDDENERSGSFGRAIFHDAAGSRTSYDYADAFLHRDPPWSRYYVTQWSPSVDLLLRARAGRPLVPDGDVPPPLFDLSEPYAKIVGASEDKLRIFSTAHRASDDDLASFLNRGEFRGDLLFLSTREGSRERPNLSGNDRLQTVPRVLDFGANRMRVEVDAPSESWLLYCDAWHPDWRATVDGIPTPVERANLAYKAVRIHPGRNVVEFRFHAPLRAVCGGIIGVVSLFWCILLGIWTLRLLGVGKRVPGGP